MEYLRAGDREAIWRLTSAAGVVFGDGIKRFSTPPSLPPNCDPTGPNCDPTGR